MKKDIIKLLIIELLLFLAVNGYHFPYLVGDDVAYVKAEFMLNWQFDNDL